MRCPGLYSYSAHLHLQTPVPVLERSPINSSVLSASAFAQVSTLNLRSQAVIRGFDLLSIPIPSDLEHAATYLDGLDSDAADDTTGGLERNIKEAIEALWADAATRSVVDQSMSFQLNDSAS